MERRPNDRQVAEGGGLSRRELVAGGAALGALGAVVATSSQACAPGAPVSEEGGTLPAAPSDFELSEVSIADLQSGMEDGRWSSAEITRSYLGRIAEIDRQGPTLRSVIETNPEAVEIAGALDDERARGEHRGPLHGIPILLKDNIATADRTTTTAGSLALEGSTPLRDSFVAERLREAGVVLLGKANLSEWANFRSNNSSSGWSGRGGQCRNPYVLDRNPCGSSSGSGVATSASLCAAAIGTETNGSVVCPSNANGLVGIKPTVGLVSRSRIVPISHTQDTAGPMARTVHDATLVLEALVGVDPQDPATAASEGNSHADYAQFLGDGGLNGKRIGLARDYLGFNPRVDQLIEAAISDLAQLGAEVIDPVKIETRQQMSAPSYQVLLYEFKAGIASYLAGLGDAAPLRSLAEIIAFNETNADREMPYFAQEILIEAEAKGGLDSAEYLEALAQARRLSQDEGIDATMNEHRLDAIVAPTGGPAWVTDLINGDHFSGGSSSAAAIAGYPNITVPMGVIFGLPVGISIFGRAWSEPVLLEIAYAYEQATRHRQPPRFLATAEVEA